MTWTSSKPAKIAASTAAYNYSKWLSDRISPEAQSAIASHDRRTGIQADTLLADAVNAQAEVVGLCHKSTSRPSNRGDPERALRHTLALSR
jgi:hypothetical protein